MKKKIICLMIACLSLFAYPYELKASSLAGEKDKTELPVIPPAMEKKVNEFKKNHPDLFAKKDNRDVEKKEKAKKSRGLIGFAISVGTLILIILLILLLI